jgi:hypothetical protein
MYKFVYSALVVFLASRFLVKPTPLSAQGFAPSGQALCYVDGVINTNPQACNTYLL